MTSAWDVFEEHGTAAELHGGRLPVPDHRLARVASVQGPALVLGSTQPLEAVDLGRAQDLGLAVARRRSGGGAVLLRPGHQVWLDVGVPRRDPLWDDDVSRSARWLGRSLAAALVQLGVAGAVAHTGPIEASRWSSQVCFAGRAPGEVLVEGRKVVGTSQRRTRAGAVFQVAVALAWAPAPLVEVLRLPAEATDALATAGTGLMEHAPDVQAADVVQAIVDALP